MSAIPKTISALFLAFGLGLAPAFADGGGGGDFGTSSVPENPDYLAAVKQIDKKNYAEALPLLQKVLASEPKNADALNYLGFTHRQMGQFDAAVDYYQQALAIEPEHLGANEYLGELWLQVGDLPKAEQRLEVLDGACFFGCKQYYQLRDAIRAHKQKAGG